jgi:hypothetical protein
MLYSSIDGGSTDAANNNDYDINKFDNFTDININYPSYFTAQGDYAHNNYINNNVNNNGNPLVNPTGTNDVGTTIHQLKTSNKNDNNNQSLMDSLSFDDNSLSEDISLAPKKKPTVVKNTTKNKTVSKPLDHDYCVNIITKELLNNDDATLMSSHNGKVYKHVKTCEICKNKIKKIMKEQYCDKKDNNIINLKPVNHIEHFEPEEQHNVIGYDIKELILIILAGIILIFIFDLLVRMGERLPK